MTQTKVTSLEEEAGSAAGGRFGLVILSGWEASEMDARRQLELLIEEHTTAVVHRLVSPFCYLRLTHIPSYGRNFQSDTPVKKLVRDIVYIRAGERKLTETVQNN